ncbi:ADP-ribosyltransferase [Nocardiopsis dassonvillei]|uniref:ADP-ribosyltransferase n=1 Tax=Nocardiopsis dassonvillei TaxID=2014 RepID=UPI0036FDF110
MGDSAHDFVKVVLGIDLPRASAPAMRAASEVYDLLDKQLHELSNVMDTTRTNVRRHFGGAASDYYNRSLAAFTSGDRDYIGNAASTSRMLSTELRKAAANVDYMVAMVWVQVAQLIAEIAWAIATAKFTFGASLKWIPVFKAIRSLAIRRLIAWFLVTVPSHQVVSQVFASFGALIQRVQIANGDRDGFDKRLAHDAHVGAVIEGLVSAGISGGVGAFVSSGFANAFSRSIDDLRGLPDPVPPPQVRNGVPDPVPPPSTLNDDLADLFTRHRDEMLVPFHPNSPTGARSWDNVVEQNAFRAEVADVFQRSFAERMGADQARRLGDDYADTLIRSWGDPDLGSRLSLAIGDRLPPPLREHLSDVPQSLAGSLHQSAQGFLPYVRGLGLGAGTGAAEGFLSEGLGSLASGQGFVVTPWSATSGATMNTAHQLTTDSALAGIDALSGPGGTLLPPDLPPPPEPERTDQAEGDPAQGAAPTAWPASGDAGGRPTSVGGPDAPDTTVVPPVGVDGPAPARDDGDGSRGDGDEAPASGTDAHRPGGSPAAGDQGAPAARRQQDHDPDGADGADAHGPGNPSERVTGTPETPAARAARNHDPDGADHTDAYRRGDTPDPLTGDHDATGAGASRDRTPAPPPEGGTEVPPPPPAAVTPPIGADRAAPPQGTAPPGRPSGEAGQPSRPGAQETTRSGPAPAPAGEAGPERNAFPSPVTAESPDPAGIRETAAPPTAASSPTDRGGSASPYSFDASLNPVDGVSDTLDGADDNSSLGDTDSDASSLFDDAASETSSLGTAWSDTEEAPPVEADAHPATKDTKAPGGVPGTPDAAPGGGLLAFPVTENGPEGRAPAGSAPSDGPVPEAVRTDPRTPPPGADGPSADRHDATRSTGDADTAERSGTGRDAVRDQGGDGAPPARSGAGPTPSEEGVTGTAPPESDSGEAAPGNDLADARAERAADLVAQARRHLDDGDVARARAVGADIQNLLAPRPDDGSPPNPSVRRARALALGLVFTLSDPANLRVPAAPDAFPADKAEDAATLLGGVERNLRDRHDPARARLWLPGGSLTTQYVRDTLSSAPPASATQNSGAPVPGAGDAPRAAEAATPDTAEDTPAPARSADTDAPAAPPAAGPERAADTGSPTPAQTRTDPAVSGIDPRADARAASVLDRLPELTRALADKDIPRARALGAEFWRSLRPVDSPVPENRSIREARTLAQALVYTVSDPSNRRLPLSGESIPPERVQDAETLARGIGRHLRDRHDPVRARLWLPGGRLTTDYVRYAMQDPADRGPSPYGAPPPVTTVNTALVDGDEDAPAPQGRSGESSTPDRTGAPEPRATDADTQAPPTPLSPSEAETVAQRARETAEDALGLARGAADRVSAAARTAADAATGTADAVTAAEQAARAREETARAAGAARDAARLAVEAARGTSAALDRAEQAVREAAPGTDAHRAAADAEAAVRARHEETVRLRDGAQRHARDADAALRDAAATADDALTTVSRRVAGEAERTATAAERAANGAANALRVTREAADRAARAARDAADADDTASAVTAAEQAAREGDTAANGAGSVRMAADQAEGFAGRTAASVALAERIARAAAPGTDAHRIATDDEAAVRAGRDRADRQRTEARARVEEAATARHDSTTAAVEALTAAAHRAASDSAGTRMAADDAYRRSGIARNRLARAEDAVRAAVLADTARPRRAQESRDAARRLTDAVGEAREAADAARRARTGAESFAEPARVAGTTAALDSLGRVSAALRSAPDSAHPAAARVETDLRRTDALVGGARDLLGRTAQDLADARRHAQDTALSADRAEALLPRDLPSASRLREKTDARYDLDYLVTSRLSGPDRLFTRAVHQAVAGIVGQRIADPPPDLPQLVDAALNRVAHEHGMSAFFAPGGREITVTDPGTDGSAPRSWTVRISLASEDPAGYRHLDVEHRKSGAPLESREEERSRSATTGGSSSYDPRRILAARFTGSPLLLGDVTGSAAGPWVTAGGSFSRGQRAASHGGTTTAASKIEYTTFAKPEFYANDLRVWAEVTARPEGAGAAPAAGGTSGRDAGEAPAPAVDLPVGSSVIRDGMVFTLAGEVQGRPDGMPGHIDLAPGAGEGDGPGRRPRNLGPTGGLPIAVHSVTPNAPAGRDPAHTDLGSWVADYLVSDAYRLNREATSENTAVQWMKDLTGPGTGQDIARWQHEIRHVLDNDSFQEYLPHLDRGPVTVSASHPRLGEVMMEFSARPRDYRIKDHSPLIDDATFKESVKDGTSLTQSRNTSFTLTGGTGFGLVAELPSGGTLRVNAPHVEATWWQSLHSESHNASGSGEHRSLSRYVSSTERFAAYEASHDLFVHVQGEAAPHHFTVTGVELLPGETAGRLDRAARGEESADSGGEGERRPPFPHLDTENPVHFRGSHFLGLEWSSPAPGAGSDGDSDGSRGADAPGTSGASAPPVTSDDRRGVLDRYLDDVLAGIAREHPGLVIPELARDRGTYARRPGREEASYFERSFRERWGFRRSYDTAYKNTMLVRDTLQSTLGKDGLERLARPGEGLPVRLRESATVDPTLMARLKEFLRPDTVTVRLHAEFGRLSHDGKSTAETGLRVRGTASASTESATGSAFTLAVSAGSGMVRSAEGDARGFARLLGGFMASMGWNRVDHFDAAYGLEHKSDARLFFPEGSDRWSGEVILSARLHDHDAEEQADGTSRGTELLDRPIKAAYSVVTPTTVGDNLVSARPDPDRADRDRSGMTPDEAREMLDPRPGRRDSPEEDTPGAEDGTAPAEETSRTSGAEGETPVAPPTDNTRVLLDHGAIIEHVNPLLREAGDTGPGRNLLRRTLDAFSRPRRFWSDGGRMKLSSFLDSVGGSALLSNLVSPTAVASDPASFAETGRRRRIEMRGTWLSPNDMRATGVTKVTVGEITDLRLAKAQVTVQSETVSTASAAVTRISGFFARFTGFAGGTTNSIEEGGAESGADRSTADGIVPMAGPSHNRSFLRRGETMDSGVSSASGLLLLPKAAAVYAFTAAGSIAQAWEFKKHRGLNLPNWWTHRYAGWKARVDDLVSGYITARDAEQAGVITDAVTHGDDGAPEPSTQANPTPPPHARVRAGFDSAGRQTLPVDPARAVDALETRLRTHGLTLSRGGKERLLVTLSEQLGTATDALPPIPVNVVSTDRNAHFSKPARVLVELDRTNPRVDYVTSAAATVETHSWQAEHSHQDFRQSSHTTGLDFVPWQPSGTNGGSDRPPDSSLLFVSPAAGAGGTRNASEGLSSSSETTHTIVMESSGPYVKMTEDASLTLTIEVDGDGLVPTAGVRRGERAPYLEYKRPIVETATVDGGRVRTFHLGSSLDFTPPAVPAAPLDTVPAPPTATPRAGDTLAGALTTATGELAPPPDALRDAVIMPTAVHGPDLRDTALRTVAASLGWEPPAAPDFGGDPTAEQLDQLRAHHARATDDARRHIADRLELDPRYTPIDNSLNPVALKGLLSHNLGRPSGTDILRIGRTQWRVAATPDFTGARIVTARPDARLVHKEAEGRSVSHSRSQGGGATATTAFRPTGHHTVDPDDSDRNAYLTGSGEATARTITGDSPTGDGLASGEPSDMERQRLGTAYLVEFDTTWTTGARTDEKTFFGGTAPRQFTSHHTNRTSAWISRSDAVALGVLTSEQADAAEAPITAEYDAAKAMADAEAAYTEQRATLPALVKAYLDAYKAHAADPTPANRAALDGARTAYGTQATAYRTALEAYDKAVAAWTTATNATAAHLAGITPPDAPPPAAPRPTPSAPLEEQLRPVFGLTPREAPAAPDPSGTTTEPDSRTPAPAAGPPHPGTTSRTTVFAMTDIAGEVRDPDGDGTGMSGADLDSLARGLGLTDTDGSAASGSRTIHRLPTGAETDRYGDLLHDPAYNPNTFDALPTATQDAVSAYTRSSWLNRFARLSPLDEATVQAELDRIREESRPHPGWQVYEIGGGRWPDLARLEEAAQQGTLSPEQTRIVRGVLDNPYPQAALDNLQVSSGSAGRIAESLALHGEPAHFPDAPEVLALLRRLDRATGHPFPEGFEAVHGMYHHQHLLGEGSTDPHTLAGTTHVEQGYLSVSLGTVPSAAGGSPIDLMRLTVPHGSHGLWVGDRSQHPREREVILTRGTRYQITAVEPWGRGYLFHAQILPPAHDDGPTTAPPAWTGQALERIDRAMDSGETAAALTGIHQAAQRLTTDLASALRDADGPDRTATIDRLEGLRDTAEHLADRAGEIADTAPEAVAATVALAADLAAAAQSVAARGAADAAAARDAIPEPSEVDPENPDRITDAARERDTALTGVSDADAARDDAERAAHIAYDAADTATRTAGHDTGTRVEEARAAAQRADTHRRDAITAAQDAADRHESLSRTVNVAANIAVGIALGDAASSRGDAAARAAALDRARSIADLTPPGSVARARLDMRMNMPGFSGPFGSNNPVVMAVTDVVGEVRDPDGEGTGTSGADLDSLARGLGLTGTDDTEPNPAKASGPATGTPPSAPAERKPGADPAADSLLDTFHSALNTQTPPGRSGPVTGEESSDPGAAPSPRPVPARSAPEPNTSDETTVFLMETADEDPAEEGGRLPEPGWTREREDGMADLLGLEDPAARAAELDDPGTNPHTFDALPREQREAVVAQAASGWLSSLTWIPSLDADSIQNRLEDLTYDAGDNASGDDLNGWPLYEKNGNRWPTLTEIREIHSDGGSTRTFDRLVNDIFRAPDPGRRLRHWYDNADEAGALAKAADGAYPTADEVLDTLRTLDAATDRPLPGPVEVTFALSGDEGLQGLVGYVEGDPSSLVGTEQREAGYLRTSLDRSPATGGDGDGTALVRLTVPEGGHGLWIGDRADASDPYTLLLPRGTGYRVTGVTESDGVVEITAVALPAEPRPVAAAPAGPAAVHDHADRGGDETDDGTEPESDAEDSSDAESDASDDEDSDGRGTLDEDGIRRFDSSGEIDGQDRWLQDPANNPHAFDTLTPDQQGMVDAYTRSAWITRVARIRPFLPQTVARQLMEWRSQSRAEAADPDTAQTAHGWDLYEANGLVWPSVERLRQIAASPRPVPPRTRGLIRYVLDAPDPRAELDHWFHNAGYAGVIARLNGGVYPDAAATRRLFRLLDSAVDRPLPEGMAVSRGMQSIDHLLRTTGGTDPRLLVGTVHTEPGYMSTTLGDSPFKTDSDGFPFLLRLDVPQGSRGLWIGTRSHDPEQMELTLGRGTTYRITGVQDRIDPESGGPQTVLTATVVALPRAVPDLFSEGSTGEDGVRRFWSPEEAHWYGHRLHDPAHNPYAVNALPRARHDLARALSALAGGFDLARTGPDSARELLESLRAASRVTQASTPADRQRVLGWELYEANGLTWPSPDRLLQLLPVEQGRNPARARFITDILRHGPQEAARRLGGLYNTAGAAGVLARANGGVYPSPERLLDMLASYEDAVRRPLPEAVESTWHLDHAAAREQLRGFDPRDPSALAGTEQTTRGYTAVALNPRPTGPGGGTAAVVRLVLPPGAHGLWLGDAGPRPQNQEVVLPPGTAFRIDSVDTSGDRPVITARVHAPTDGAPAPAVADGTPAPAAVSAPPAAEAAADGTNDAAGGTDSLRTGHGPGDGRGYIDGNGIRRFRTEEELDAYDLWLHDPSNNPHAFRALAPEHRDRVIGYTIEGWLNTVARESMNAGQVAIVLDLMRQDTVAAFETNPMGSRGWELYEMNGLAWPTLDQLRELLAQGRVPERAEGFVRYILDAQDPQEELDHWYVHAGEAGEIARSSGDAFPTPERALEHLRTLTEAIDRPLPEGIEVIRGLEELDHLEGFDGKDPYSLVGTVHTERGFMSTSLGNELAGVTARYAHAVHLVLPRGSRGLWIGSESRYPGERELILPPGTTYRITRAGWGGSRGLEGLYIEAEVIVPPRPGTDPAPPRVEESADLHVFTAETDTDATVTDADEPGLGADEEAGLAALLGLEDSGHESADDAYDDRPLLDRYDSDDDAYDDRPLLDRYDSDDDAYDDRPLLDRYDSDDDAYDDRPLLDRYDSDDDAPTASAPLDRTDDGDTAVAAPETSGGEARGFRTREELDAYAERMDDLDGAPHTYGALPPELRALIGAHTANPWLSDLSRLAASDPALVQDRLDRWSRTSLEKAADPDRPNGWVLYEANGLSWPSLDRVRELYAGGVRSPAFAAIAADVFGSSDPKTRLEHWYRNADDAGEIARANGGVYPTGDRALELIRDMDAAVDRPLSGPIAVSFALDVDRDLAELDGYDWDDLTAVVGRVQRERGYTTVSLGDSPFTTAPRDTVAVVRMVLPEDARGLWVGDRGSAGDRYALVLPRDFAYRVTDLRITADGMEIDAEPVPVDMSAREPSAEDRDDDSDASTVVDEGTRLPAGDGRGHVGDDGYRRFRSLDELNAYDRWLHDPANNPHAFDTLPADRRRVVDAYTRSAWITRLARIRPLSPAGVASQLELVRTGARHEAGREATVATAHGWDLYEANGLTWPTLDRLREIRANPDGLSPRTAGLVDYVLTARDPAAELRHWFHNAGYAGVIARHNGGTYPDVDRVLELFRLLDDAVDRPLPEGLVVSRGMHSIDHLLHAVGGYAANDLEGTVHTEPGYMSTTLGDQPFKTDSAPFRYLLRLNVPEGAHGLWIGSRSHDPGQRELTLARGSTYRITGVRDAFDPNTGGVVTVLSAEVVLGPEAFADPLSDGRVDASGVRRFRTPSEADWYAHRAARAERGMPVPDTLPAEARRVVAAFSDTPWLADLALVPPGDMRTQLDRLRSMSRIERPSVVDPHGRSGWELYEANGLTWPTPERLREIVDAAEEGTPRTHFLWSVLTLGRPEERLAELYRRSGTAGALAAANGGTYPSAEGVRELLETYDEALGRPLPEAVETTWVLPHTRGLRFPEGYDEGDPSGLVGTVQSSPGYTTVSVNPEPVGLGHPAATVRLTLPAGAHGLWLGAEGPRPSNHEIVLPRGMSYRVTGAERTAHGLLLSAEAILPERAGTASGARPPTVEDAPPATGGTGKDTTASGGEEEHTAHTDASADTSADTSVTGTGLPVDTVPADDGRGYVDDRGVRRFRSVEETDAYGRWLHDPANNPHAFDTLHERQREDVRGYTADGWLNAVVRDNLPAERVQDALDRVRESTRVQVGTDPMAARGWSLYELNGLSWPTVERLRELLARDLVPGHTAGFVGYILDAPDPEAELAGWYANAGGAGTVARSNGGVFPTAAEVTAFRDRLDQAVDRPLPETVETVRGLSDVAFLDGFRDMDPYSLVGTVQTEPGFMSVSLGNRLAGHHKAESRHVVHLTVPAGSRGLWVGERSDYPEERELILARGTTYRITRAGWGGSFGLPGFHIEAEVVVPQRPETVPAPEQQAGDTSDLQVFSVQTSTYTTVTGPAAAEPGDSTETFLTALLGLDAAAGTDTAASEGGPAGPDLPDDRPGHVGPDGVRRFATDDDGAGYGKLVLGGRFPSLTAEQQNSARAYTKNAQFYNDFSRHASPESEVLRLSEHRFFGAWVEKWFGGHIPSKENAEETWGLLRDGMDMLDRAMEPVPETVEVRRSVFGVGFMAPPGRPFHDPTDLIGTEFVERGFLSGSLGVETVNQAAAYQFHLAVPAGHPALWIGGDSVHRSERELLLPRGTRFRVDDALQDPDTGQWTLRVTVLPFTPRP